MATGWSKDSRPARQQYWDRHVLEIKKVANILANKQRVYKDKDDKVGVLMTEKQALKWWQAHRKGRVPDKYIPVARLAVD